MTKKNKVYRLEILVLIRSREQIVFKTYRAPSQALARNMGNMVKGVIRVVKITEVGKG